MVLANSEFRHELESDIEPFKGLLLGLFFITVGAGIDFARCSRRAPLRILALTLGLLAVKAAVLLVLATGFRLRGTDRWLFALGLAQAGEFGFVLVSFSRQAGAIDAGLGGTLSLAVALSMLVTPLLFLVYERVVAAAPGARRYARDADEITEHGHGDHRRARAVRPGGEPASCSSNGVQHRGARPSGRACRRAAPLRGRRASTATPRGRTCCRPRGSPRRRCWSWRSTTPSGRSSSSSSPGATRPDLHIVVRAFDRVAVYALFQAGANDIIREIFDSSVRAGRCALEGLGLHPFRAQKLVEAHVKFDRESMRMLAEVWDPELSVFENAEYVRLATQRNAELERA